MNEFAEVQRQQGKAGVTGWWDRVMPDLSAEQVESLEAAAADRNISHRTISIVLGRWGFQVSAAQVGHWRRTHVG